MIGVGWPNPNFTPDVSANVAIVAESVARLFLRNSIARAIPILIAPSVTSIIEDGQTLEIDYPGGVVRNPESGKSVELRRFPPLIERIFAAGGLPEFAYQRYMREQSR